MSLFGYFNGDIFYLYIYYQVCRKRPKEKTPNDKNAEKQEKKNTKRKKTPKEKIPNYSYVERKW